MKRFIVAIYKAEPISFETGSSVEAAVERLSRVTVPSVPLIPFQDALVGRVAASGVVLRYHRSWFHNAFAPVFMGRFTGDGDRTSLEGRFTLPRFQKVILTLWLALISLVLLVTLAALPQSKGPLFDRLAAVFMSLLMLGVGVSLANIGWWIGRRDVEQISRRVREALLSDGK